MKQYMKISEFARLSGIARKNLIFYDEIDLLKPERVLDNGYRLYSFRQLEPASVISVLREIGMSLPDIKGYLGGRSPEALLKLLYEQKEVLASRMDRLRRIDAILDVRLAMTSRAIKADVTAIEARRCPAEPLFASRLAQSHSDDMAEKAAHEFYDLCDREGLTYGYPLGGIISQKSLEKRDINWPERYFFRCPATEPRHANLVKPAGLYLVCFEQTYYDGPRNSYDRMYRYMDDQGYRVAGDGYEEFLLDEIAVKEPEGYLMEISIQVEKDA